MHSIPRRFLDSKNSLLGKNFQWAKNVLMHIVNLPLVWKNNW